MKFFVTPYHHNLLNDCERIAIFHEAILDYYKKQDELNKSKIRVFDIGCGSGVLSYFASKYFKSVVAIDKDEKIVQCFKKSIKNANDENLNNNLHVICGDVLNQNFHQKADLIVCEMLDTALIDEEEVLVINHLHKYLKDSGDIIPEGVVNIAEPVYMELNNIHYEDGFNKPKYEVLGDFVKYSEFDFYKKIDTNFKTQIQFKIAIDSKINGIKITTFTKLNENIICGPTPMLNPPLFIPLEEERIAKKGEIVTISLEYTMGSGIETIKIKDLK